ncbi:MAG: preprotein translocase subunit SecA [Dehalococcoidales bacterium]|jgi:preprotein translocase subunit SecA|nr:preprotein translocase subunit SecA [Dehalococcoidales bacterium]
MLKWLGKLIDSNEKELKHLLPRIDEINSLESEFKALSDTALRAKTEDFKARFQDGSSLDELLPEAFAAVRETARRTIGQRHFDVQMMGGIILHQGKIAEMRTGEGKTLVATLPLYLNSLSGQGCHLVTVNDYLAKWQHLWMAPIYQALGVTIASIQHDASFIYDPEYNAEDENWNFLRPVSRNEAYRADIVYGTNNEFGFDYLRDNMVPDLSRCTQRDLNYAIVDEVDNILIDEARTPLIISGPAEEAAQKYQVFARLVPRLRQDVDYTLDERHRSANLTEAGIISIEALLKREGLLVSASLYDPENYSLTRHMERALKAHVLFKKDQNYVVKDGEVVIVDEFTGRLMPGRRYSEGLHQAIEAKERVQVQRESTTFATVTFQNYFRMYLKLSGMTGTALTEAEEFHKIYRLEVVVIPTNKPMIREDAPDRIYKDEKSKFKAVVNEVAEIHKEDQPVLIGTVSIERSELLSDLLKRRGIAHQVLNAKQHEKEAHIIAQAGRLGAVTVATNMAGRGVDIMLGGNPTDRGETEWQQEHEKVIELGGLFIIGTERHEARRIDNQLRGRGGRQGDPGNSRFYVSVEDDIMKRFGGDRIKWIMEKAGMDEDTPIENKMVNRAVENAQVKVEGVHFDMRKHLVEYDDVVNHQRELIYGERRKILGGADLKTNIMSMVSEEMQGIVFSHVGNDQDDDRDIEGLLAEVSTILSLPPDLNAETLSPLKSDQIEERLIALAEAFYQEREEELGSQDMRVLERMIMLRTIDSLWIEQLTAMEEMRLQAQWQSLRQVKAVDAYKKEGYAQFQVLMETIRHDIAHTIFHVGIARQQTSPPAQSPMAKAAAATIGTATKQKQKVAGKKVGRNDPCPCGSGKKYKHCHGG